jgi:hypothetical protein
MELLLRFWCLEVLPGHLYSKDKPFIIWFHPPLLDYDVSMDEIVELVVVIPTSPSSSKTESGCKSYNHFCIDIFSRAGNSAPEDGISGGQKFHNFRPCEISPSPFSRGVVQPSVRGAEIL